MPPRRTRCAQLADEMADRSATADVLFTSQSDEPFRRGGRTGGSGFFQRSETNNFWGIGPHFAVELKSLAIRGVTGLVGNWIPASVAARFTKSSSRWRRRGRFPTPTWSRDLQQATMLSGFLGPRLARITPRPDLLLEPGRYWWDFGLMSSYPRLQSTGGR